MADSRNGSRATTPSTDLLRLARTYGITRDQARRLIKKFRNDPKKLDESAKVLSARSASPSRLPRASGWGAHCWFSFNRRRGVMPWRTVR